MKYIIIALLLGLTNVGLSNEQTSTDSTIYLLGHTEIAKAIASSPDGKFIASTGDNGEIIIWPVANLAAPKKYGPYNEILRSISFSEDGKYIWAPVKGVTRIDLRDGSLTHFPVPTMGSFSEVHSTLNNTRMIYVTVSNKIYYYDIMTRSVINEVKFFGGFIHEVKASPNGKLTAISSQNEVNNRSTEPCKLTIWDENGNETMSYQFNSIDDYHNSQHIFLDDRTLILCIPGYHKTGKGIMYKWLWSDAKKEWVQTSISFPSEPGRLDAIAISPGGKHIWLASGKTAYGVNVLTGKTFFQKTIAVGSALEGYAPHPIESLAVVPGRNILAVACWDGRVALINTQSVDSDKISNDAKTIVTSKHHYFTCKRCGSTITSHEEEPIDNSSIMVMYRSPSFCKDVHKWETGISSCHPKPIPDGILVLVKKKNTYGAFILSQQSVWEEEKASYKWWYRTDGDGDLTHNSVITGSGACNASEQIRFGPFIVRWSGNMAGKGWISYDYMPGEDVPDHGLRICVTGETSINGIDAADSKWKYKGSNVK